MQYQRSMKYVVRFSKNQEFGECYIPPAWINAERTFKEEEHGTNIDSVISPCVRHSCLALLDSTCWLPMAYECLFPRHYVRATVKAVEDTGGVSYEGSHGRSFEGQEGRREKSTRGDTEPNDCPSSGSI